MKVARRPHELERRSRAVAIGTFDGVHVGHRAVVRAAIEAGPLPTVVTFHPHPREVLGYQVSLLSTLERRLALLEGLGFKTCVVPNVPGCSSTVIRRLTAAGDVRSAAPLLGRPVEVEGTVV